MACHHKPLSFPDSRTTVLLCDSSSSENVTRNCCDHDWCVWSHFGGTVWNCSVSRSERNWTLVTHWEQSSQETVRALCYSVLCSLDLCVWCCGSISVVEKLHSSKCKKHKLIDITAWHHVVLLDLILTFWLCLVCLQWHYMFLCVGLALPFLLQPVFFPFSAEKCLPLCCRYSFKANVWLAIFSFIGSYWYTHYFYSVLGVSNIMCFVR